MGEEKSLQYFDEKLEEILKMHDYEIRSYIDEYRKWVAEEERKTKMETGTMIAIVVVISLVVGFGVGLGVGYWRWGRTKKLQVSSTRKKNEKDAIYTEMSTDLSKEDAIKVMQLIECLHEIDQVE